MPTKKETLLEKTRRLAKQDERSNADLARLTGLNYFWIRNFRSAHVKNPGIQKVEQLHDFLNAA